ncbi:aminoacyl-tRNA hydrolase [Peptoniphilus stercorisuis]|uniref:Peptidyl-tRNA hydrolase n=1 Tax=Peptoniphilus stercorisuis TaxID=1436965 RepID=A0ABS4KDX0_9FIRM|nr:aminoacyl-tRNA hydrolase [Peptoniphilus stercorisuis]MBP2025961.1 PTH1 family peptidyl-tRNA hydrolase [Peptoniphilus stercorisuis]
MYIIAGLGNPGSKYENTRHNMGFLAIDNLAKRLNINVNRIKFKGLVGEGRIGNEKIVLLKPQTYMNNSGESIREILSFYKETPENLIVFVDDIDIGFANLRIKKGGSAGTHNGLKSIIHLIQSDEFPRIKIGVGKQYEGQDLADFVLSGFSKSDGAEIEKTIDLAVDAAVEIVENNVESAMNKYNRKKSK